MCVEVGRTYNEMSGDCMYVVRDVPKNEVSLKVDPAFDYVEVVYANNRDMSNGWRRKNDGRYPPYAHWDMHPSHLLVIKEKAP